MQFFHGNPGYLVIKRKRATGVLAEHLLHSGMLKPDKPESQSVGK